jgi:hypothetical protein
MARYGPHLGTELIAAGVDGLPFAWGEDGRLNLADPRLTEAQRTTIAAVFAAHDPNDSAKLAAAMDAHTAADFDAAASWLQALALVVLDEINLLRTGAGLAPRTRAQLKNAVVAKRRTL